MTEARLSYDELLEAIVGELELLEEPLQLNLMPATVFTWVGICQLALRHPDFTGHPRAVAEQFIVGARMYFGACAAILEGIDRGEKEP